MADIKELTIQLTELYRQRDSWNKKLAEYTDQLAKSKFGKRGGIKKSISECEQQIKRIDRQVDDLNRNIRQLEKIENQEILANKGIDSRANMLNGVSSIVGSTAQLAGNLMGSGGLSAIGVGKQTAKSDESKSKATISSNEKEKEINKTKSNNTLFIIIGVVIVVVMFLFKGKK